MKLIERTDKALAFRLSVEELALFLHVLQEFPGERSSPVKLSNAATDESLDAARTLLEESLDEHRRENARAMSAFLQSEKHIQPDDEGVRLTVGREQVEWLLQVLNELRVASWEQLGCPGTDELKVTEANVRDHLTLDVCGMFQMALLDALGD